MNEKVTETKLECKILSNSLQYTEISLFQKRRPINPTNYVIINRHLNGNLTKKGKITLHINGNLTKKGKICLHINVNHSKMGKIFLHMVIKFIIQNC